MAVLDVWSHVPAETSFKTGIFSLLGDISDSPAVFRELPSGSAVIFANCSSCVNSQENCHLEILWRETDSNWAEGKENVNLLLILEFCVVQSLLSYKKYNFMSFILLH